MNPDQNYFLKPGETPQQYQTRVDQYNASKGGTSPTTNTTTTTSGGMDMFSFQSLLQQVQQRLQFNNSLATQRQLIMKHLFDSPLTPQEMAQLPQDVQGILGSGDRNAAELQLQIINDNIQGRGSQLASAIQYLTSGYQTAVQNAETQKKDVMTFINNFAKTNFAGPNGTINTTALKDYLHAAYNTTAYDGLADALGETTGGNMGPGTTSDPVDAAMQSVVGEESGGNYQAISPVIVSGQYAGQRSYGKYQVLESNIPTWTQEALGYSMTPQEFLANPQAQDQTAKYQFQQLWNKYGNIRDVASAWLTGMSEADAKANGVIKDQTTGMSVEDYINNAEKQFNQSTQPTTTDTSTQFSERVRSWGDQILAGNVTSVSSAPASIRSQVVEYLNTKGGTSHSPLADRRYTMAANAIVANYIALPGYSLTANGLPYLQRIDAAMKVPGSVSDQDLLDSLTKLNSSGNAISDAQVRIITDGKSFGDQMSIWQNKLANGGVLSDSQRQQVYKMAQSIYANYKKGYQPVYDQATSQLKAAGIPEAYWTIPDLNKLSSLSGAESGSDNTYNGITLPS